MIILNVFGVSQQNLTLLKDLEISVTPIETNPFFTQDLIYRTSGINRSTILSTDSNIDLDSEVVVQQAPFYNHIRAFSINGSRVYLGAGENTLSFRTVVYSDEINTYAIGVDRTGINPRQNMDNISISAEIIGNTNKDSWAIGVKESFIGLGNDTDTIEINAIGPNALWGQRAVISGGQDESADHITGMGNAENVVIRGWDGDDIIDIGKVSYTGPWTLRKEWIANGTRDRTYNESLIHGGTGYDTLRLQHMNYDQFMEQYTPLNTSQNTFMFKDTPGVVYESFEKIITNDSLFINL